MPIIRRSFKKSCFAVLLCGLLTGLIFSANALAGDIAVYGDSQHNETARRKVVQAVSSFKPSIAFRVGDNVDDGDDPKQWELSSDINGPLLKTAEYFPALGNHEKGSPLYFDNFPFLNNKRWYSVDREGIHFIILDSNSDLGPGSEQYKWLESDLGKVKESVKFKIVLFHHPIFGVGEGHREDEKKLRPALLPLFKKYGVSIVFSGHEHSYQRFEYEGIFFLVTGGGGSRLHGQDRESPYLQKFKKAYHFCLLSPEKDFLRIRVIDTELNIIDDFNVPALKDKN